MKHTRTIVLLGMFLLLSACKTQTETSISTFEECITAGNPAMESYPRQCKDENGNTFTEVIDEKSEGDDTGMPVLPAQPQAWNLNDVSQGIRMNVPTPGSTLIGQIEVSGEAVGTWFFEALFDVQLLDANGNIVAEAPANATGDWMTENYVPFTVVLDVPKGLNGKGDLVFKSASPSGLPEHEKQVSIPVQF